MLHKHSASGYLQITFPGLEKGAVLYWFSLSALFQTPGRCLT